MIGMDYAGALEHLFAAGPELPATSLAGGGSTSPRRKFDLAHMRRLCQELGDPQLQVPSILIAGTNGKGSTAATLASILTAAGYRAGLYTSPHLIRVNERFQLAKPIMPSEYGSSRVHASDGALALCAIADEDFARIYTLVNGVCERLVQLGELPWSPSFFERLTALAFVYFAGTDVERGTARADIMVLEVGLGGRLDATNVVEPLLSVITDISLDHQDYLGDTVAEIAREKAGILRKGGTLVTLSQHPEANQAIGTAAAELQVRGVDAARYLPPAKRNRDVVAAGAWKDSFRNHYQLSLEGFSGRFEIEVDSPLPGEHQQRNIALALATAIELRDHHSFDIPPDSLTDGVHRVTWPGRLQFVEPNLILDVAHNPAGAWTLRAAIAALPEDLPRTLVFSCLQDKDLAEMSHILFPLFDSSPGASPLRLRDTIILAPIQNARSTPIEELVGAAKALGVMAHAAPHVRGALAQAREVTPEDGVIIVTGSVYLVGEVTALAAAPAEACA